MQQGSTLPSNWTIGLLVSSLLSLIVGTVAGLTQFRIKRLLAYSTISHAGFILLALSISSVESTQAFIFYLIQYTISNLNAFIILVTKGYSLYYVGGHGSSAIFLNRDSEFDLKYSEGESANEEYSDGASANEKHSDGAAAKEELLDEYNSPIQLISQLKGYFYENSLLSLSLAITIFSFLGIPPLVGFFAKQMVLSAALDNGYIFLSLIAILTSVIGGVYYLNIIKEIFFFSDINSSKQVNPCIVSPPLSSTWVQSEYDDHEEYFNTTKNITISTSIAITISIITLIILLFIFINKEWLSMGTILVQILFNN